jgi:hypothetical protein
VITELGPDSIPEPALEVGWEQDATSQREAQYWDEYDEVGFQNRSNTVKIHKAIGWCIPIAIIFAFVCFLVASGVYLAHIVLPASCRWLTDPELDQLHTILFSGIVGAAVTQAARTYLSKKE